MLQNRTFIYSFCLFVCILSVERVKMGLFGWLKSERQEKAHAFDKEDRELSLQVRRQKAELAQQRAQLDLELMRLRAEREKADLEAQIADARARLDDMYSDDEPEVDNGGSAADAMLMMLMSKMFQSPPAAAPPASQPTPPSAPPSGDSISDEELQEMWEQVPSGYKKLARKMSDEQVAGYIRKQLPNIDTDSMTRALRVVRGK